MKHINAYLASMQIDPARTKLRELAAVLERMPEDWRTKRDVPHIAPCEYGCGGTGWLRYDFPMGHPLCGKVEICQCTKDKAALTEPQRIEKFRQQMSATEQTWTLKNWIGRDANAKQKAIDAVARGVGMITFHGAFGTGKSGLLAAMVNSALDKWMQASYMVVPAMLDDLRAAYNAKDEDSFQNEVDRLSRVRVLALDEMWRFKASQWTDDTLFKIIDHRYRFAHELLTIIGTNALPEPGSDALISRLMDRGRCEIVKVNGTDLRPLAAVIQPTPAPVADDEVIENAYADAWVMEFDDNFVSVPVSA